MSNRTLAFVGAPGTKAKKLGWSVEIVAGARTSAQRRRASSPPMPPGRIVGPARRSSSSALAGWSSGWALAMRPRAYPNTERASASVSSVYSCIERMRSLPLTREPGRHRERIAVERALLRRALGHPLHEPRLAAERPRGGPAPDRLREGREVWAHAVPLDGAAVGDRPAALDLVVDQRRAV